MLYEVITISFLNTEENPFILQSNYIRNIFCDSSDRVFIATTEGVDCIRQSIDGVITSYSIHYTKLYEEKPTLPIFLIGWVIYESIY